MSRLIIFGATGSLGTHVLRLALAAGHEVSVFVRTPSKLLPEAQDRVAVHQGDLNTMNPTDIEQIVNGHDALINCAGLVTDGQPFVDLVDRLVTAVESLPKPAQPVCWFLAGLALLDLGPSGRRGVDLPKIRSTYWPHRANFERINQSNLDWRVLCPGPLVQQPALGLDRLRTTLDRLPVEVPALARKLPGWLFLPVFASRVPQMIVSYADAAALMLANLNSGDAVSHHRVGLALPVGMKGKMPRWTAKRRDSA